MRPEVAALVEPETLGEVDWDWSTDYADELAEMVSEVIRDYEAELQMATAQATPSNEELMPAC